jgi:hypothetical protein
MSKTVKVTLSDAMYQAAKKRANQEGRASGAATGISGLMRNALRAYLNKNGYKTHQLDAPDAAGVPGARSGKDSEVGA